MSEKRLPSPLYYAHNAFASIRSRRKSSARQPFTLTPKCLHTELIIPSIIGITAMLGFPLCNLFVFVLFHSRVEHVIENVVKKEKFEILPPQPRRPVFDFTRIFLNLVSM